LLVAVAAPSEARAVLAALGVDSDGAMAAVTGPWRLQQVAADVDLVITGVGKVNAGGGIARVLDLVRHGGVLNLGIAGALPGGGAGLGAIVAASASVYADEGLLTPDGFTDCAGMGFPLGPFAGSAIAADQGLMGALGSVADLVAPIATVSTCSGTDALATEVARRTGAVAEAMEGAAGAHVAARLGVPFLEVRAISNTTGDRAGQRWDVRPALEALGRVIGSVAAMI
jgi:futalosine hydrolase